MDELHSSKAISKVERDLTIDNNKIHFVILNDPPRDNSTPLLYLTKFNPDLRSEINNMEESKDDKEGTNSNSTWPSGKIDLSILCRDNDQSSELPRAGHRVSYLPDDYGEEKFTYSPDPPLNPETSASISDSSHTTHYNNEVTRANAVEHLISHESNEENIPITRKTAERWSDPPSKAPKSQSIEIHDSNNITNIERPRVYSAISSLEESFQLKNQFLGDRPSHKGPTIRPFSDVDRSRTHTRTQTALADGIISFESTRIDSNSDLDQTTTQQMSGILKGKKHEKNNNKITFDQKESTMSIIEPQPVEMFRPSCDAYTPRMGHKTIKYKPATERPSVDKIATSMGTIQRPNFRDALRRVAMIIHQHIVKIERRFELCRHKLNDLGLFCPDMRRLFAEDNFVTPRYVVTVLNFPTARPGLQFGKRRIKASLKIPSVEEIYDFAHQLFHSVQLSSECSIVCLIYVERLMEIAKVPLMSDTWRPIVLCGLLLASKVWQDLSSWNIEFASVYPQFSLAAINRIESQFLKMVKWDLYISTSLYAKYYFALRSLCEKRDFRQKYVRLTAVEQLAASEAIKIQERSSVVKEGVISELSRSM